MKKLVRKARALVARYKSEIVHDVTLFAGALVTTGLLDHGAPLTRDAITAAVVTAARRVLVQLFASSSSEGA